MKAYQCNKCKHSGISEGKNFCQFGFHPSFKEPKLCKEVFQKIEKYNRNNK